METSIRKKLENYLNGTTSRDEAFESLMPYAKKIASKYYGFFSEDEDILSAAYEGLIFGLEKIKDMKETNFVTIINQSIMNSIRQEIASNLDVRYIGVPRIEMVNILIKIRKLTELLGRELSKNEILALGKSAKSINALQTFLLGDNIERLDETLANYENLDTVKNEIINPESSLIYDELRNGLKDFIINSGLNYNEIQVLIYSYLPPYLTEEQLAAKLEISLSYARKVKYNGLKKLKEFYSEYFLDLASAKDSITRIDVRGLTYKKRKV